MKKIFTLIAAATMALGASAQTATWNFSDWTAGTYTADFSKDGLTVYAGDAKNAEGTKNTEDIVIESNNKTLDGVKYTQRLKTGGGATTTGKRALSFVAEGPVTITIAAMSSSSKDTDPARTLLIGENAIPTTESNIGTIANIVGSGLASYTFNYTGTGGTIYMCSASGGINFYAISVAPSEGGGEGGETPTPTPTDPTEAKTWDFTTISDADIALLDADATNWSKEIVYKKDDAGQTTTEVDYVRYGIKGTWASKVSGAFGSDVTLNASGTELEFAKGLKFARYANDLKDNNLRIDANKRFGINSKELRITIPGLAAGDVVRVKFASANASEARGFKVGNLTPSADIMSANSETIVEAELTVTAAGNVTLESTAGLNLFAITINAALPVPTAISSVTTTATAAPAVMKYVENGKVVIVKDGKKFNIAGAQLK